MREEDRTDMKSTTHVVEPAHAGRLPGEILRAALRAAGNDALVAISRAEDATRRREAVRATRRALKDVRALSALCRPDGRHVHASSADGAIEFAAKANQLLGPLRDRDALVRSIQRLADRFADGEPRRVVRTVLLATLIFAESDRAEDDVWAQGSLTRAHRALRSMREAMRNAEEAPFVARQALDRLLETHRHAAATLRDALAANDLVRLHDSRKLASFLALALQPFGDTVPSEVARLRTRSKRLVSALGEDRDWALLDVEMARVRSQLGGSALVASIDDALRLARLEASARMEDAARAFLRLRRRRIERVLEELLLD